MKKNIILLTICLLFLMTFISYSEENNVENIGKFKPKQIRYADNKINADNYYFDEETENDFNDFIKEKTSSNNFTIVSKKPDEIIIKENDKLFKIELDYPDSYFFDDFDMNKEPKRPKIQDWLSEHKGFCELEWGLEKPISKSSFCLDCGCQNSIPFYAPLLPYKIETINLNLCNPLTENDFINKTNRLNELKDIFIKNNNKNIHYILSNVQYYENLQYEFGEFYGFYKKEGEEEGRWYKLKGVTEKNCEEEKKNEPNPKNEEVDNKFTPSNINKKVTDSNLTNKTTPSNIINKVTNSNISKDNKENNTNQKPQTNYSQVKQNITQNNENAVTNDLNKKELSNEEKNKIENKINDVNKTRDIKTSDNLLGNLFFILSLIAITSGYLFVNYKKIRNK